LALVDGVDAGQRARLAELVNARSARVPVQHLIGRAGFRHLELAVGPGVFVPRPETESLAGWGVRAARAAAGGGVADGDGPVVVDLCSGSGAIALAVAQEAPRARSYAVEADPAALEWLRRNAAERAAAGDRPIEIVAADVTDSGVVGDAGALAGLRGRVDVLLCNPPYVPDRAPVPPEVADHDPARAVFGGPDGLAVIRPVIALAAALLRPGGVVGIEHDDGHGDAVPALLAHHGAFVDIVDRQDLAGRPRFATATRARGTLHCCDALRLPDAD
jgi:release factor glutamine methyltransferase